MKFAFYAIDLHVSMQEVSGAEVLAIRTRVGHKKLSIKLLGLNSHGIRLSGYLRQANYTELAG